MIIPRRRAAAIALIALALIVLMVLMGSSDAEGTPEPPCDDVPTAQDYVPCEPTSSTTSSTVPEETTTTTVPSSTSSTTLPDNTDELTCDDLPSNIPQGDPAYSPDLDADSDGIACEGPETVVPAPVAPPAVPVVANPPFAG
jgi:cytoskeletal protein RodZ